VVSTRAPSNQLRYLLLVQRGNLHILTLVNQSMSLKLQEPPVNLKDLHPLIHQCQRKKTNLPPPFYLLWLQIHLDLHFQSRVMHALHLPHVPLKCTLLVYHLVQKKLNMEHQIHLERKKEICHWSKCLCHSWRIFCPR